ncbi:hypothetical protein H109_00782 [Trichophyton interdigitale MR816]|uniref:Uncharacterized protein n=1 Tax=Trichophyton interdigitale (strain MR816) TaxID=1215338 RepID=A0A059JHQ4_TRIIM|nr:hypothetical protein H101_07724 [Trichophyton interdigitale H6]KDB27400.1 hypothetical protein H109_00782 [Trichophyton interdigitale MR816]
MHFFSKTTIALTVALAAFSDASSHGRHRYRHFNRQVSSVSVPLSTGCPTPTSTMVEPPAKKPVDTSSAGMTPVSVPTGTGTNPKPTPPDSSVTVITSVVSFTLGPGNSVTSYTYTTSVPITRETRTVIPTPVGPPSSVPPTTRTRTQTSTSTQTEWVTLTEACASPSQGGPGSAHTKAPENPAGPPSQAPTIASQPPAGPPADNTCPPPTTVTVTQATATVTKTVTITSMPTPAQEAENHAPAVKLPDQVTPPFPSPKPTHPTHPPHPSHPSQGMPHGTGSPAYHFPTGLAY